MVSGVDSAEARSLGTLFCLILVLMRVILILAPFHGTLPALQKRGGFRRLVHLCTKLDL